MEDKFSIGKYRKTNFKKYIFKTLNISHLKYFNKHNLKEFNRLRLLSQIHFSKIDEVSNNMLLPLNFIRRNLGRFY